MHTRAHRMLPESWQSWRGHGNLRRAPHPVSWPAAQPSPALRPACRMTCRKCQVNHIHVIILFISILRLPDAFSVGPSGAQQSPLPPARDTVSDCSPNTAASCPNTQCSFTLSAWAGNFFWLPRDSAVKNPPAVQKTQ